MFILDVEFLEQKAFDVCDIDEDGGLSWDEVELCEVITMHSSEKRGLRSTKCSSETLQNLLYFCIRKPM